MSKIDETQAEQEKVLTAEEQAEKVAKKKKETDENIAKKLNDPKFLNFLQKNPDAVNNANNNEYLTEKIEVFEKVQKVKAEVKKYITAESNSGYAGIVDDSFVEGLEEISIENPDDFLDFSTRVSKYLESISKIKSLDDQYQKAFRDLQMEGDYTKLTGAKKIELVNSIHDKIDRNKTAGEEGLVDLNKNRSLGSRIGFLKAGKKHKEQVAALSKSLAELKLNEKKLNKDSILDMLNEIEAIKSGLKGNKAFEILRVEFDKKAKEKIEEAKKAKNYSSLAKNLSDLEKTNINQSILDDEGFQSMREGIREYSKQEMANNAIDLFEKKEAVTLSVFEKGIEKLREEGLKLGLTEEECNEQIKPVLEAKIEDLTNNQAKGQNKIKLILAIRTLNNLE